MPRIRPASRSGWNTSSASVFSPVPRNLTGIPVTAPMDRAAPPRASPSILVRTRPVTGTAPAKPWATVTASWPVIASTTSSVSTGFVARRDRADLVHERVVDREPAGGVDDHDVAARPLRVPRCRRGRCPPSGCPRARGRPGCRGSCPASRAGRRRRAGRGPRRPASAGGRASTTCFASFAADVVLPEPWRPTRATTAGLPTSRKVRSPADRSAVSSSLTIFTTCWPAVRLSRISAPERALAHARDEVLDDLEVDVRLEQREPDLAHRRVDVRLGHAAAAGQTREGLAEAIAEAVEHARTATLAADGEDQAARRTPSGWCAGSGDTEAARVYAMASRTPVTEPPGTLRAVTSDPLLDPVPPARDVIPSPGLRRNGAFMRVWSAATVSVFGSFVTRIALPFVAILDARGRPVRRRGPAQPRARRRADRRVRRRSLGGPPPAAPDA